MFSYHFAYVMDHSIGRLWTNRINQSSRDDYDNDDNVAACNKNSVESESGRVQERRPESWKEER